MARRHNNNLARHAGFTLIELLLALALSATLTAVLFESLHAASNASTAAEQAVAPSRVAQVAFDMLRQDFRAVPSPVLSADGTTVTGLATSFTGVQQTDTRGHNGDLIDFYTLGDGQLRAAASAFSGSRMGGTAGGYGNTGNWYPSSEIKQIEITLDVPRDGTDFCLLRRVWHNVSALNQNQTTDADEEEVICRHVDSFSVRYYDGTTWQDSWDSTTQDNQLPAALEITLSIDPQPSDPKNATPRQYIQVIQLPCSNVLNDTSITGSTTGLGTGVSQ